MCGRALDGGLAELRHSSHGKWCVTAQGMKAKEGEDEWIHTFLKVALGGDG